MSPLIHIAFVAWLVATFLVFASRPPAVAAVASFVAGWLFLPNAGYELTGLHNKTEIVSLGVLAASLVLAPGPWRRLRPRLLDLVVLVAVLTPLVSARANDLTWYNAGSSAFRQFLKFGVPYLVGRAYLSDLAGLRAVAVGVFLGGVAYIPFCLYEIRMSPQLHRILYGFHQHEFIQTVRWGGFRPMVFMQHGLAVGMWMTAACLAGVWLWRRKALRSVWGIDVPWLLAPLLVTTLLVKSVGALVLLAAGLAVLFAGRWLRTALPVGLLALVPPAYIAARASGAWSGQQIIEVAARFDPERAESVRTRLLNENDLVERAFQRPLFGWGGYGRAEVRDDQGQSTSIRDGLWVILLGETGLVGLVTVLAMMLAPPLWVAVRLRRRLLLDPALASAAVLTVLLALTMIDSLFNAFTSPPLIAASGGLLGLAVAARARPRPGPVRRPGRARWPAARGALRPAPEPADRP